MSTDTDLPSAPFLPSLTLIGAPIGLPVLGSLKMTVVLPSWPGLTSTTGVLPASPVSPLSPLAPFGTRTFEPSEKVTRMSPFRRVFAACYRD